MIAKYPLPLDFRAVQEIVNREETGFYTNFIPNAKGIHKIPLSDILICRNAYTIIAIGEKK